MTNLLILGALLLVPALLLVVLKANGGVAFLSLCLGNMLVTALGSDVSDLLASFSPGNTLLIDQWTKVVLLLVPFVVTMLFTKGSVASGAKLLFNIIVSLACGALLISLVMPLLPSDLQNSLKDEPLWQQVNSLYTAIIILGAITSMAMLLRGHASAAHEGKKHK
jgi:hypothetical protein